MKIEKLNNTQIKFILNNDDLKERQIDLSDITSASNKGQTFFREIMSEALEYYDFELDEKPLLIEAVSVSQNNVIIIISKVKDANNLEDKPILIPRTITDRKYIIKSIKDIYSTNLNESERLSIFSFKSLDDISDLSNRLTNLVNSNNIVCKLNDEYFLIIHLDDKKTNIECENIDTILSEYGKKHVSNIISKYQLLEQGELIIKNDALNILASIV